MDPTDLLSNIKNQKVNSESHDSNHEIFQNNFIKEGERESLQGSFNFDLQHQALLSKVQMAESLTEEILINRKRIRNTQGEILKEANFEILDTTPTEQILKKNMFKKKENWESF